MSASSPIDFQRESVNQPPAPSFYYSPCHIPVDRLYSSHIGGSNFLEYTGTITDILCVCFCLLLTPYYFSLQHYTLPTESKMAWRRRWENPCTSITDGVCCFGFIIPVSAFQRLGRCRTGRSCSLCVPFTINIPLFPYNIQPCLVVICDYTYTRTE